MRILLTGSSGQLGSELMHLARNVDHEIFGASHAALDIRDAPAVDALLRKIRPDVVVNCAAWTKVDLAETHREQAFAVNADGAATLARACAAAGLILCHLSTDYVFGGFEDEVLDENAEPFPLSVYGASKLAGENAVRAALPQGHVIVRTSWLYGREGPNFVLTMLRLAREHRPLRVVDDQYGAPTWTGHLAPALIRLLELDALGTVHLSSSGSTTWCEFAEAIVHDAGAVDADVEPITTAEFGAAARRPVHSVLENRRWRELGQAPLPHWRTGLRAYLAELGHHPATVEEAQRAP